MIRIIVVNSLTLSVSMTGAKNNLLSVLYVAIKSMLAILHSHLNFILSNLKKSIRMELEILIRIFNRFKNSGQLFYTSLKNQ